MFIFSNNLECYCHVELEDLIRHVNGDLKLAIGNACLLFKVEVRVVYVRDAGTKMVFKVSI